jgi:mono/diheme cytochrome c family protein
VKPVFPLAAALCLLASLAPCGGAQAGRTDEKSGEVYAALKKAPEKARTRGNPLVSDPQAAAAGRLLFEDHCAECHGDTAEGGKGRKRGPSLRAPEVQEAPPGALFWLLSNGVVRKGMPVWSKLPEPQRWQLVVYLKSLGIAKPEQQRPAKPE